MSSTIPINHASNLSHNLINSLYVIKGIAESHLASLRQENNEADQGQLLERATRALSETMSQASQVIEMIQHFRSVLAIPHPAAGKNQPVSVHDVVRDVLHAMAYEFPFHRITLLKILPHDLSPVLMDRNHLETVLFQLIHNARQALAAAAGLITIEAEEKFYLSGENRSARRLVLRVSDTGPGIPYEVLPHIFDPFFTTKNSRRGNGLGLYLVKKVAEYYSGTVRVETSERGTSFYVEFPR